MVASAKIAPHSRRVDIFLQIHAVACSTVLSAGQYQLIRIVVINAVTHALTSALGEGSVVTEGAAIELARHDVFTAAAAPYCVVRPADIAALKTAVKICSDAAIAMVPRGGGASYTDGYLYAKGGHVLFDLTRLDFIEIDQANAQVRVGSGVTWLNLKSALDPLGLRTPFWGPFSGIAATVGGSVSQNSISHGSGRHGISAQSVLGIEIVLANGELLNTALSKATRHYGPDLTGLFTGDCGALGLKAAVTLPLLKSQPAFEAISFACPTLHDYHALVSKASLEQLDDSHFGVDLALSQGQIGKQAGISAKIGIVRGIIRTAPSLYAGIKQLLRMAAAGEDALRAANYMAHFIVEGTDTAEVSAKAARIRQIAAAHSTEIANTTPAFVRAMPFAPLYNILGPKGERWVPVHGILPHERVSAFHADFESFLTNRKSEMEANGLWVGTMFSSVGATGFLYEVAIYWPDARTVFHETALDAEYLSGVTAYPPSEEKRSFAHRFKQDLVDLFAEHDAAHFQIGRAYPYFDRLDPSARAFLLAMKAALDPGNLMNPGALGLDGVR